MSKSFYNDQKHLTTSATGSSSSMATILKTADFPNITKVESDGHVIFSSANDAINSSVINISNVQQYDALYYDDNNTLYRSSFTIKNEMTNAGYHYIGFVLVAPSQNNGVGIVASSKNFGVKTMPVKGGTLEGILPGATHNQSSSLGTWAHGQTVANTSSKSGKQLTQDMYNEYLTLGSQNFTHQRIKGGVTMPDITVKWAAKEILDYSAGPLSAGDWYLPSFRELLDIFDKTDAAELSKNKVYFRIYASDFSETTYPNTENIPADSVNVTAMSVEFGETTWTGGYPGTLTVKGCTIQQGNFYPDGDATKPNIFTQRSVGWKNGSNAISGEFYSCALANFTIN